ncbi:MAG: hypothetical protein WD898_03630 [Candidatus Paceibacterota bacterium]
MSNKITILLLFVLAAFAAFLGGYFLSHKSVVDTSPQQGLLNNTLVSRFKESPEKYSAPVGLFTISREKASFPYLAKSGKDVLYYYPSRGEVRSSAIEGSGNNSALVATIKPGALDIQWSSESKLLATYVDGNILYDLSSGSSKELDKDLVSPSFSNPGAHVVYNRLTPGATGGDIRISDADFTNFKTLLSTRIASWDLGWIDNDNIYLLKQPTLINQQSSLLTLGVETKKLSSILGDKKDLQVSWSPDGQKLLYSYVSNSAERELYVMTLSDKNSELLDLGIVASQCVWSIDNKTVFCGSGNSFFSLDTSITRPEHTRITSLGRDTFNISVINPLLTSSEAYVVFINDQDGKLYGLSLDK